MTPAEFKVLRESLGLSAQWLATAVHVDQRTVRRWQGGAIPLRADVVTLLTRIAEWDAAETGAAAKPDSLPAGDWPVLEIPRVDAGVADDLGFPAAYHRAVAARVRRRLGGQLHLVYADRQRARNALIGWTGHAGPRHRSRATAACVGRGRGLWFYARSTPRTPHALTASRCARWSPRSAGARRWWYWTRGRRWTG
ncbi:MULTISPECIES: DNA-binding transcriptional regulator [Actinosynnema]|uniref:helix-turn-helix domain-containing protein n=1 Tax=Actinosynnema TaxID=40566 RepID=UPI0020A2C715|nr:hypothetical protein [Actinosynnema pretiosum]